MKKIALIIELCVIVAGFFAMNYLVENVLDPDYTAEWQIREGREELPGKGEESGIWVSQYIKKTYWSGIMRDRKTDRFVSFALFSVLIAGYYCAKAAANEVRRRGVIIPADETKNLDVSTIASNRIIVLMRFLSILLFMGFALSMTGFILGHPMPNSDQTGHLLCVNTNPYFSYFCDHRISMLLVGIYMPIMFFLAPYFVFRKITNAFTLKYCLTLFAAITLAMSICVLLSLPLQIAGCIACFGVFASFNGKMNRVAKTLGM